MFGINPFDRFERSESIPPHVMADADQIFAELKAIANAWIDHRAAKGFEGKWDDDSAVCSDLGNHIMSSVAMMGPDMTAVVVGILVNFCARNREVKTDAVETASDPTS